MRISRTDRIFPEPSPNESLSPSYETRGLRLIKSAGREATPGMVPATLLEALEKSIEVVKDGSFATKGGKIGDVMLSV